MNQAITKILIVAGVIFSFNSHAQTYCGLLYSYDSGGNRIKREVIPASNCGDPGGGGGGNSAKRGEEETTNTQEALTATFFPNPTTGQVTVQLSSSVTEVQVSISDNSGRVLHTTQSSGSSLPVDLSRYADGLYMITAKTQGRVFRSTVIKR